MVFERGMQTVLYLHFLTRTCGSSFFFSFFSRTAKIAWGLHIRVSDNRVITMQKNDSDGRYAVETDFKSVYVFSLPLFSSFKAKNIFKSYKSREVHF